jgi:hypothetical protein
MRKGAPLSFVKCGKVFVVTFDEEPAAVRTPTPGMLVRTG